jgi:hypothetical protein
MRVIAALMLVTAAAIGAGGAMEFAYFGPDTPQFLSGLIATTGRASVEYERFLNLWANADAGLPELSEATRALTAAR